MKRHRAVPLLVIVVLLALLSFPASAAPAGLSIGGRVTGPGGSPVAGARVRLVPIVSSYEAGRLELEGKPEPEPASSTQADKDGRFRLAAEPGMWRVVVEADGFVPLEHQLTPLVEEVELPAAGLERDARLEVRAAGPDGRPLAGAIAWTSRDLGMYTRTAADGTWRLSLAADWKGGLPVEAAAAGRFPESAEAADKDGSRRTPTLALPAKIAIAGTVVDEKGRGVAGAEINAALAPGSRPPVISFYRSGGLARSGESGRFRLASLAPGLPYALRITRPGFAPARAEIPPQEPGRPSQEIRIVLRTGRIAFGRVLDQSDAPVAGAEVTLRPVPPTDRLARLQRIRETDPDIFRETADASGRFELPHLPAGTYDLIARGRGFAPLTVPGLVLPEGAGSTDLGTVVLAPGVALQGVVFDSGGRPVEGAEVRAREATDDMFAVVSRRVDTAPPDALTGADGFFRLEDRAPGEKVDLEVSRSGFGPGSAPGVVVPTEEAVRIVLVPASRVSGRVTGPDGKPVAGVSLSLWEMVSRSMGGRSLLSMNRSLRTESDDEGGFLFESVSPGPIEVRAEASRHQPVSLQGLEVKAGQDLAGLEIVLAPGGTIEGRVLSPAGRPVPGAEIAVQEASQGAGFAFPRVQARADGEGRYVLDGVPPGPRRQGHPDRGRRRSPAQARMGRPAVRMGSLSGTAQLRTGARRGLAGHGPRRRRENVDDHGGGDARRRGRGDAGVGVRLGVAPADALPVRALVGLGDRSAVRVAQVGLRDVHQVGQRVAVELELLDLLLHGPFLL